MIRSILWLVAFSKLKFVKELIRINKIVIYFLIDLGS